MNKSRKCQLHPQYMEINENGVGNFFWPVSFDELEVSRDYFLTNLVAWVRNENIDKSRDAELIWLMLPALIREFMRIFNALAFVERAHTRDIQPDFFDNSKLFVPIYEGRWPEKGGEWQQIYSGLNNTKRWRRWGRIIKYLMDGSLFYYKPKWALKPNSDVMTCSRNSLIEEHAKQNNIKLILSNFNDWFTTGSLQGKNLPDGISALNIDMLINLIRESYMECHVKMPDFIAEYLRDYIVTLGRATEFYLREAESSAKLLPLELWTGSMGMFFYRILGRVVQKEGGVVTSHDHGTGTGWYDSFIQTIVEFNYSDRFIVSSSLMAEGLYNSRRSDLMIRPESTHEISFLDAKK